MEAERGELRKEATEMVRRTAETSEKRGRQAVLHE